MQDARGAMTQNGYSSIFHDEARREIRKKRPCQLIPVYSSRDDISHIEPVRYDKNVVFLPTNKIFECRGRPLTYVLEIFSVACARSRINKALPPRFIELLRLGVVEKLPVEFCRLSTLAKQVGELDRMSRFFRNN